MAGVQHYILTSGNRTLIDDIGVRVQSSAGDNLGQYRFTDLKTVHRQHDMVKLIQHSGEAVELRAAGDTLVSLGDAISNGMTANGSAPTGAPLVPMAAALRMMEGYNVVRRVSRIGGLIGLFMSQRHAVEEQVRSLNQQGYRVVVVTPESRSFLHAVLSLLLLIITLFMYTKSPDLLVIGERVDSRQQCLKGK